MTERTSLNPRILLVDDHPIVRQGLARLLEHNLSGRIFEADSGRAGMAILDREPCDLIILDLALPDRSGIEVLKDLRVRFPGLPVLVLSVSQTNQVALRVMRAGAACYLEKDSEPEELVHAVRQTLKNGHYLTEEVSHLLLLHSQDEVKSGPGHKHLSDREYAILLALGQGQAQSEIARREGISPKTVSTYRTRILEKLGLQTTADLVRYCLQHDLLNGSADAPKAE
ncbi:MAG: response regulator transcription factor [Opitutales bacterium]